MTKRHSTRKSLIASLLILCLCFTSFVGTTFAWFTDSVTSANNIIKSGNLDIDLQYATVKDGQISGWSTVDKADKIFDPNALWEPGRVEVVYLKATNLGTLALKYQLRVNIVNEIPGTNVAGEEFNLSDHLVFKVVDMPNALTTYTDREAVAAAAGTEKGLKDYSGKTTSLEVGGEDYVALIVYMPESVGNEANYRGDAVPTITLGVNMFATQDTVESDSFDDQYDDDAWHPSMTVGTASELAKAIDAVADGGTIVISDDLVFDESSRTHNSDSWYEGLYYVGDKSFTIDLNGSIITNDSSVNDYLLYFKNDGTKANTITIKNGIIEASSSAYCAICTSTTSTQKITINLENVNLIGNNSNGAVAKIRGGAEMNLKSGSVVTGKNSYVGIEATGNNTVVNVYDGAKIYQNGTSSYVGSLLGVSNNATANVYGGYGVSAQGGFIAMTSGGTINVSGGEWIANTDGTYANGNKSVLISQSANGAKSDINVYGGTFKGGYNCYGDAAGDATINISGGNFNADPATYVDSGFKAVQAGDEYHVISESVTADLYIASAAQLKALADEVNSGNNYQGKTIVLLGDINLGGMAWTPIGNGANGFSGTFDGRNYTISNYTVTADNSAGLFGYMLNGGNVKNLKVKNAVISANDYAGAILGRGYTDVVNCHAENVKVTVTPFFDTAKGVYDGGAKAGAIVGQLLEGSGNTVVDCSANNVEITGYRDLGGVLGMAHNNNSVSGCTASDVTIKYVTVDGIYDDGVTPNENAGAVVGRINSTATVTFVNEGDNDKFTLIVPVSSVQGIKDILAGDAAEKVEITLESDLTVSETITVPAAKNVTLDLNGHDIIGTSTSAESVQLFSVSGNLEIVGEGTISLKNDNYEWTESYRYTTINIRETGVVTLGEGVNIVCEAGANTAKGYGMAYAVDIYTTGTLNVNGASLHSNYIAVRCFYGNSVVNVNGGSITSSRNNFGIWPQSAPGAVITIADGIAYTIGDYGIYIFG